MTKVLFLSYNGLLEPILSSQAIPYLTELAKDGYEFVLLTYEKRKDVQQTGGEVISKMRLELKSKGIEWRRLKYHKRPRILATLADLIAGIFYSLYLIMVKNIKIVHVRGITPGVIALFVSKALRIKILFDMRGLLAEEYAGGGLWADGSIPFKLVKKAERVMLKRADAVTVLTEKHRELNLTLDYLKNRDIPMNVIPCCVDMKRFNYDDDLGRETRKALGIADEFVLVYPGKIGTFYLIREMFDFYKTAAEMVPRCIFLILTNDSAGKVLEIAAHAAVAKSAFRIIEGVNFDEMPRYIKAADAGIFFINSYKKIGSSPIKMGEFLACGVPVIINPGIGDTEELVMLNSVGVVVRRFDEESYRDGMDRILALKSEGELLRRRCRRVAAEYLSLEKGISRYRHIYNHLSDSV